MQGNGKVLVSVIMPVYNAGDLLRETLDTVIGQTLKEIEIICVDDGSSDNTLAILQEYANADERIMIIKQNNQYAGVARNNGLSKATGKYVVFWDADDLFELEALEKMYMRAEEDNADICVCGADRIDNETGERVLMNSYFVKKWVPEKRPFSKKDMPEYFFQFSATVPWNKMFLRTFVQANDLQFQNLKQANDTYFIMLALFLADRITYVDEKLVMYRVNNDNSITGKTGKADTTFCVYDSYIATLDELMKHETFAKDSNFKREFANRAIRICLYSLSIQKDFDAYTKLFNKLYSEGLAKFGLIGKDEDYYHFEWLYEDVQIMLEGSPGDLLLHKEKRFQRNVFALRSRMEINNKKMNEQQRVINSLAVRTALKVKKILTFDGKLRYKK